MQSKIITGDSLEVLPLETKAHAIVTDPPYGLAFMGKSWDDFEPKEYQAWCEKWAKKAKQSLKPGGHLVAFSGNRTHHRLFTGVEDAGFEIRDTLTWHYGSGFPKALDVSKAIDKTVGAERKVIATGKSGDTAIMQGIGDETEAGGKYEITEPATDAAKEWDGWKTALKPATEFIVLARKPLEKSTVAENIQAFGTGALNIDATRIDHNGDNLDGGGPKSWEKMQDGYTRPFMQDSQRIEELQNEVDSKVQKAEELGRYPANVIFDTVAAQALDDKVGELQETGRESDTPSDTAIWGNAKGLRQNNKYNDGGGGPSRYFYTSKATKAERTINGQIENNHPTVKPIDLMEWLVKLVTKEGQLIIDPFAGSGTTGKAAKNLNRDFVLIEQQEEYADIARARCGLTPNNPELLTEEQQSALSGF